MPDKVPQSIAAIIAESTAQLDAMIAANLAADKAFISGTFRTYLAEHIRATKEAMGIVDGEPDKPDTTAADDVAGEPQAEVGEAEAG